MGSPRTPPRRSAFDCGSLARKPIHCFCCPASSNSAGVPVCMTRGTCWFWGDIMSGLRSLEGVSLWLFRRAAINVVAHRYGVNVSLQVHVPVHIAFMAFICLYVCYMLVSFTLCRSGQLIDQTPKTKHLFGIFAGTSARFPILSKPLNFFFFKWSMIVMTFSFAASGII